jgi:hypothetical protein
MFFLNFPDIEFFFKYSMFESVIAVVFLQSVFSLKMYQNNIFLFFKNYFYIIASK